MILAHWLYSLAESYIVEVHSRQMTTWCRLLHCRFTEPGHLTPPYFNAPALFRLIPLPKRIDTCRWSREIVALPREVQDEGMLSTVGQLEVHVSGCESSQPATLGGPGACSESNDGVVAGGSRRPLSSVRPWVPGAAAAACSPAPTWPRPTLEALVRRTQSRTCFGDWSHQKGRGCSIMASAIVVGECCRNPLPYKLASNNTFTNHLLPLK